MNRRGFMGAILAAAVAPAIVRADSLMRIVPMDTTALMLDDIYADAFPNPGVGLYLTEFGGHHVEFSRDMSSIVLYNEHGPVAWADSSRPVVGDTLKLTDRGGRVSVSLNDKIIIDTGKTQEYGGRAYLVDSTIPVSELAPRAGLGTLKIPRLG